MPVATESVPVATESMPVATETVPVATESVAVATETVPVATESVPVATESVPVATESVPVATECGCISVTAAVTKEISVENRLITTLMTNYSKYGRPIADVMQPVNVYISFYLTQLMSLVSMHISTR